MAKWKSLSRVLPSATSWTAAFQAPLVMGFSRQEYWTGVPLPSPLLRFKSWEIYLDFNSQGWRSLQTPGNYSPLESWLDSWFNFINLETFTKYHGVYPTWKRSREVDRFWPWRAYSRVCVCVCVVVEGVCGEKQNTHKTMWENIMEEGSGDVERLRNWMQSGNFRQESSLCKDPKMGASLPHAGKNEVQKIKQVQLASLTA